MMNKIVLAIMDLDGLLYQAARPTIEDSVASFRDKFQNILNKTNATHYLGFVGKGKTFRNTISSDYKANRKGSPPKFMATLKEWAIAEYHLCVCNNYEADDAVAYWMNQDLCIDDKIGMFDTKQNFICALSILGGDEKFTFESVEKVMVSPDKDLLQSIIGDHFNYTYRIKEESKAKEKEELTDDDFNKGWWVKTSESEADAFKRMQMIVGDSSDGIGGLKGRGIKYWEKLSKDVIPSWGEILQLYCVDYGISHGIYEFQKNYRLLHILDCDEDYCREVKDTITLPLIIKVGNEIDKSIIEF